MHNFIVKKPSNSIVRNLYVKSYNRFLFKIKFKKKI